MSAFHPPAPLFVGVPLEELLDARTERARHAARSLTVDDFAAGDPAPDIIDAHDLAVPSVLWDEPVPTVEATADQRMRSITTWPIVGDATALTWTPAARTLSVPSVEVGLSGRALAMVVEARHVTAQDVIHGHGLVRRYVTTHLDAMSAQIDAWRSEMGRRVRAAVRARRALLEAVADLDGSAALEAVAP